MALLTVDQAADAVGISRQTLYRHMKKHIISFTLDKNKKRRIDKDELIRVYGELKSSPIQKSVTDPVSTLRDAITPQNTLESEIERLQRENQQLKSQLETERQKREDQLETERQRHETERDRLFNIIETQMRFLQAPPSESTEPPSASKKGILRRLFRLD